MDAVLTTKAMGGRNLREQADEDLRDLAARRSDPTARYAAGVCARRHRNIKRAYWLGIPVCLVLSVFDAAWGLALIPIALASYSVLLLLNPVIPVGLILFHVRESRMPIPSSARRLWRRRVATLVLAGMLLPGAFYYLAPWKAVAGVLLEDGSALTQSAARPASLLRLRQAAGLAAASRVGESPQGDFVASRVWSQQTLEGVYGPIFGGASELLYGAEPQGE